VLFVVIILFFIHPFVHSINLSLPWIALTGAMALLVRNGQSIPLLTGVKLRPFSPGFVRNPRNPRNHRESRNGHSTLLCWFVHIDEVRSVLFRGENYVVSYLLTHFFFDSTDASKKWE